MKKINILFLLLLFTSCVDENETFTGYLVAKEYTPEHMSDKKVKTYSYSVIVVPPRPASPSPTKVKEKWVWFIANKNMVLERRVTKQLFNTKKCGDKVTIKRW
jgi:hypothetical protein